MPAHTASRFGTLRFHEDYELPGGIWLPAADYGVTIRQRSMDTWSGNVSAPVSYHLELKADDLKALGHVVSRGTISEVFDLTKAVDTGLADEV